MDQISHHKLSILCKKILLNCAHGELFLSENELTCCAQFETGQPKNWLAFAFLLKRSLINSDAIIK